MHYVLVTVTTLNEGLFLGHGQRPSFNFVHYSFVTVIVLREDYFLGTGLRRDLNCYFPCYYYSYNQCGFRF